MRRYCGRAVTVLSLALLSAGCATTAGDEESESLLPSPGFAEGWAMDGGVDSYGPETLFDYINGEAELYYPYGFEELETATYAYHGDLDDTVTANRVTHASSLGATLKFLFERVCSAQIPFCRGHVVNVPKHAQAAA